MTYQEMLRELAAVRRGAEPPSGALSDQLTISGQLIEGAAQPQYRPECLATADWPGSAGEAQCDWLPFVHKQLQAIESLPDGWDSYGAPRPNSSFLKGARNLIDCLSQAPGIPKPYVNPTRNGGVQFEWEAGERYFELEVVAERAATYYWRDRSKADQKEGMVFEGEPLDTVVEYVRRVGA
jgi:hypothetical protein